MSFKLHKDSLKSKLHYFADLSCSIYVDSIYRNCRIPSLMGQFDMSIFNTSIYFLERVLYKSNNSSFSSLCRIDVSRVLFKICELNFEIVAVT